MAGSNKRRNPRELRVWANGREYTPEEIQAIQGASLATARRRMAEYNRGEVGKNDLFRQYRDGRAVFYPPGGGIGYTSQDVAAEVGCSVAGVTRRLKRYEMGEINEEQLFRPVQAGERESRNGGNDEWNAMKTATDKDERERMNRELKKLGNGTAYERKHLQPKGDIWNRERSMI